MLTEALLSAVAEAVFGYLLQEADLADRARAVLGLDPECKAFQTALARAYVAFARQYPDLTASLFDKTFLTSQAAIPLLAQLLTRRGQPDPADLACRWAAHLGCPDPKAWDRLPEATRAAADFLAWLEGELAAQPALQPLYDSRALERIAENTEAIRRALEEALPRALAEAQKYERVVQHAPQDAAFYVLDFGAVDAPYAGLWETLAGFLPHTVKIGRRRQLPDLIGELAAEVQTRLDHEQPGAPSRYLFLYGLQRARDLRQEEMGIHTLVWCDTVANLSRSLDRRSLREFAMRAVFQMSAEDSADLVDSPAAGKLGPYRALFSISLGLVAIWPPCCSQPARLSRFALL